MLFRSIFDGILTKPVTRASLFELLRKFLPTEKVLLELTEDATGSITSDGTGLNLATHQKTLQIRFQDRIREQIEVFDVGQMESLLTDLHSFAKENNLKDLSGKLQIIGEFVEKFEIDLVIQKLQELHRIIDGKQA